MITYQCDLCLELVKEEENLCRVGFDIQGLEHLCDKCHKEYFAYLREQRRIENQNLQRKLKEWLMKAKKNRS